MISFIIAFNELANPSLENMAFAIWKKKT